MQGGRAGHDRVVHAERDEFLDGRQDGGALRPAVLVAHRVDDADQLHAFETGEDPGVVAPHGTEADEAGLQYGGAHRFSPSAFTASAIRARSPSPSDGWTGSETTSAAARSVSGRSQFRPAFWSGSQYGFSRWIGVG